MFREDDEDDVIVSNNEGDQGNPFHKPAGSPDGGQFTSGPETGEETSEEPEIDEDLAVLSELGFGEDDFSEMFDELEDLNQMMEIPPLNSWSEVEENIEKFFTKRVIKTLDDLVGKSPGCSSFQFHPKSNPNVSLNIYTCVFGKYRYPDNHANYISSEEYDEMSKSSSYERIYRGISSVGEKRRKILDSYVSYDIDNLDIYGNGMYGTNVYTTLDMGYARMYGSNLIYGLLSRNSRGIFSDTLENMQSKIQVDNAVARIKQHLLNNGLEEDRADKIAAQFGKAVLGDISLLAIMLGFDYQYGDGNSGGYRHHQRNILNLSKWYIRKEY